MKKALQGSSARRNAQAVGLFSHKMAEARQGLAHPRLIRCKEGEKEGQSMSETIDLLLKRRSVSPVALIGPGPSPQEVETLLKIASRVPDHGKLAPWRFILFEGAAREKASNIIVARYKQKNPEAPADVVEAERLRFLRAPLIIGVVSTAAPHAKIPEWEQILSAGAVCMNVLIGAQAMGYAGSWLSNWLSYDAQVLEAFGLKPHEKIAGFIHLGRASAMPEDRPRPDLASIVTRFA